MDFRSLTLNLEGTSRFETQLLADINYDGQQIIPSLASVGFALGATQVSAGYARTYDSRINFSLLLLTPDNPAGTGQTSDFDERFRIHTFFGSVSRSVSDRLSIGLTGGLNHLTFTEDISSEHAEGSGAGVQLIAGSLYSISEEVHLGLTVGYGSRISFQQSYSSGGLRALPVDSSRTVSVPVSIEFSQQPPWNIALGASWAVSTIVSLTSSAEYQHWSHVSDDWSNIIQFHVGAAITPVDYFTLRAGFFTQTSPRDKTVSDNFSEDFLTVGFRWSATNQLTFSGNLVTGFRTGNAYDPFTGIHDNHFKQSSISLGIGYAPAKDDGQPGNLP
jgi:hypothetical protein